MTTRPDPYTSNAPGARPLAADPTAPSEVGARGLVFGEQSVTKVAGFYADRASAERAAERLLAEPGWKPAQVRLLAPGDARLSRRELLSAQLEPETGGIWRTLMRAHLTTGIVGFVVGVLLWWAMRTTGPAFVAASPLFAFAAIVFFSTMGGMMIGGLISLRPDHAWWIRGLRRALKDGQWAVVAHPIDQDQAFGATRTLHDGSVQIDRTL